MPRAIKEWKGNSPDTPVPDRVRVRVLDRKKHRCHACHRILRAGEKWTCEHVIAIINGGENRENNLDVTCAWCLNDKNKADVGEKSKVYKKRKKHVLRRRAKSRPMFGSIASGWKKPMNGPPERRRA